MNRASAAVLLSLMLVVSGAWAQSEEREAEQKAEKTAEENPKREEKKDGFEYCKEKAHGLSGPERARFMTQCLRERK